MSVISGQEYIHRINQLNTNTWIDGEKVTGKISEHPAFKGIMKSQAELYDLQVHPNYSSKMTYSSPLTGNRVGVSYLIPKSKEDLSCRRSMIMEWAALSGGCMGRSPDYMNTALMTFAASKGLFGDHNPKWEENIWNFYEMAREQDLSFTHTFLNPQVNRSPYYFEEFEDEIIAAQVIDQNEEGIVIKGARLLATQGGITDEIIVFPSGGGLNSHSMSYAFSIPSNTKGLKFICRESFSYRESPFDHPLASRFDEVDAIVVFDHVLVPWNRIFFHNDLTIVGKLYSESSFFPLVLHQVTTRRQTKLEFLVGLAQTLIDSIHIGEYEHVQGKMSEIIIGLETIKSLLDSSELHAKVDRFGTFIPDINPLYVATTIFPTLYPRYTEILQLLGASGLVSIPTEKDFTSVNKRDLERYLQSTSLPAKERVQLFRLAWDFSMSAFGSRQTLYERFFFGDPVRLRNNLYKSYERSHCVKRVKDFLGSEKIDE
ncbi:4-hydroxyphenylacetate 3-monooxygenase, oxygenase component [Bacillus salitolerans]|uniref:4-hydroxyphenylacetate 3-monooxygenase, oxygenase component n=1 Tax=Bacillus salitolerans TaxID=1437434 RepID=A0ABW4LVE0_9BACI